MAELQGQLENQRNRYYLRNPSTNSTPPEDPSPFQLTFWPLFYRAPSPPIAPTTPGDTPPTPPDGTDPPTPPPPDSSNSDGKVNSEDNLSSYF